MTHVLLTFDASTPQGAAAIGRVEDDGRHELLAFDRDDGAPNQASTRLVPRLESLAGEAGLALADVTLIGCGCGPGTFTGARVAVATAKGLALGLGVEALAVSTLDAVACSLPGYGPRLPCLDARRSEVYATQVRLEPGPHAATTITVLRAASCEAMAAACAGMPPDTIVLGTGVEPYRNALPELQRETAVALAGPSPEGLWRASVAQLLGQGSVSADALQVTYLRASYAEMGLNQPKRPFVRTTLVE